MKKLILMAIVGLMAALPMQAQHYQNSRYYNPRTGRLDYRGGSRTTYRTRPASFMDSYYGFRVGPAFTTVSSDDPYLDGSSMKTGLNVGFAAGFGISNHTPLYLETGIYYTQKGGKGKADGTRFTYNLDYLEFPLVFKYKHYVDNAFSVEPFIGGYVACGVGGNIKDFGQREAYKSFSDSPYTFQRFDGGLRLGCGLRYDMLYADVTYDLGLANVSHNAFDDARNSALMLNFGIEF
ncbi:MAG: PorT family protein [Prevotella sp.]|nr:PorT family protein [Prevotella sp.]